MKTCAVSCRYLEWMHQLQEVVNTSVLLLYCSLYMPQHALAMNSLRTVSACSSRVRSTRPLRRHHQLAQGQLSWCSYGMCGGLCVRSYPLHRSHLTARCRSPELAASSARVFARLFDDGVLDILALLSPTMPHIEVRACIIRSTTNRFINGLLIV